jgi:hypothetical protein
MAKKKSTQLPTTVVELKKLLFELEKNILAVKKQIAVEDKKSTDFLEKMAKLDAIRSKNRNEYYRIVGQIEKIEKESLKRQEQEQKIQEDLNKKIKEENKQLEEAAKTEAKRLKYQQDYARLSEKRKSFEKEIGGLQEKSAILMRSVNQDVLKQASALKISGQAVSQIADKTTQIKKLFKGSTEATQAFEKTLAQTVKNASGIDALSAKIVDNMENMKKKGYELIDTYQLEKDLKEQSARLDLNATKLGDKRYAIQRRLVDEQMKEFQKLKQINQQMAEKSKQAKESRAAMIGFLAAVPGGAFIMNKMGLGKILDGTKTIKQTIKDWGTAAKGFAMALPGMALMGIFTLLITVIKKLVGLVFELDQDIADLSKQFAISRSRAEGLFTSLGKLSLRMQVVGVNVKELAKTLEDLQEEYGTTLDRLERASMRNGMLQGITLLREKWGQTNEEALSFYKNATAVGVTMDKLAQVTSTVSKNILSQKQALKAIANVPLSMATAFKGAVRDLAAFASKAKVMGIDLKVFQEAIKNSLDVESSLEDQMTTEVLSGVHFGEMDAMRQATELRQFDRAMDLRITMINRLQEKFGTGLENITQGTLTSAARMFGVDEDTLIQQATRLGEIQQQFGKRSVKTIQKMLEENKKAVGKGSADGFILGQTQAKEGASLTERFQDDMEKLKTELKGTLMPVVRELHQMYTDLKPDIKNIVSTLATGLPGLVNIMLEVLKIVKNIATVIMGLLQPVFQLMEWLGIIKTETIFEKDANGNETVRQVKTLNAEWFSMQNILLSIAGFFTAKGLITWGITKTGEALKNVLKSGWEGLKNWAKGTKDVADKVDDIKLKPSATTTKTVKTASSSIDDIGKTALSASDDVANIGSKAGIFSKVMKPLSKFASKLPLIGAAFTAYEGITGAMDANKTLQNAGLVKKGAPVTNKQVGAGALGGVLESMTMGGLFGLIPGMNKENITKGLYQNYTRQHEKYKKGEYLSLAGDILANPISGLMHFLPGDDDSPQGAQKKQQAAQQQKPQQAMAQQAAGLSRQSAEEIKKLNEQMQILGGDRTWQASKAVNQVAKSIVTLSESLSTFVKMGGNMMLPFIVKTFDSVNNSKIYSFASGITSVSTSIADLTKKLSKLDVAKLERVTQITNPGLVSTISNAAGSLFGSVKSFFGFGGGEGAKASTVPSTTSTVSSGNKTGGGTTNQSGVSINVNTAALEQKIDKLIAVIGNMASQPTYIKIGERTVEAISSEIDFRKNKEVGLQKYGNI